MRPEALKASSMKSFEYISRRGACAVNHVLLATMKRTGLHERKEQDYMRKNNAFEKGKTTFYDISETCQTPKQNSKK